AARRINPLVCRIFPLTRVTRIFQKNVFTKTTRAGPAAAVAGFLLRACERRRCGFGWGLKGTTWRLRDDLGCSDAGVPALCSLQSSVAEMGRRRCVLCFRPVIYREPYNFSVSPLD